MHLQLYKIAQEGLQISTKNIVNLLFVGRPNDKKGLIKSLTMLSDYINLSPMVIKTCEFSMDYLR